MSVVHVALLKSLIDGGPDANRYYKIVIVLIGIALAIQVVIGILAIFVTHTRNYYKKYRTDMCSETGATLCGCFPCCDKTARATGVDSHGLGVSTVELVVDETLGGRTTQNSSEAADDNKWVLPEASKDGLESVTRDVHLSMTVRLLRAELAAIEAEAELKKLNRQLENESKQPESSATENGTNGGTSSPEAGQNEETQKKKDPKETAKRIHEMKARTLNVESLVVRGCLYAQRLDVLWHNEYALAGYDDNSLEQHVLKKVSFWQNVINYLLYIVFVCNIFVTGLGVTGHHGETSGGPGGN
ncbi:hypothetical protein NP493_397g01010 [Ridgeia piscesae]|uniref:Uncharacterized protein n=1 Tax=Ridgeia piscesae TaxID=27915 RepID=A0AAD9L1E4_RIDPI|nr:hypothetical protein NP493_397g01010 [Ridgeia piscesae]